MAFKKQKSGKEAITLFGNQKLLDALLASKIFSEASINLKSKDCITIDEALITLRNDSGISYILIFAEAFVGIKDGLENAIEDLRREFHNIKVAIFFSKERPTEEFQDKAFGLKIFNLYYAEDGNFDFEKVIEDLLYGKATQLIREEVPIKKEEIPEAETPLPESPPEAKAEEEADAGKESEEMEELRKRIAALENENEGLRKENTEVLKLKTELQKSRSETSKTQEQIKELQESQEAELAKVKRQAREEKEAIEKSHAEKYETLSQRLEQKEKLVINANRGQLLSIGVFSVSHGAGATYTACALAEKYAKAGFKTACIAYDGKGDFGYLGKSKVDYFYSENAGEKKRQLTAIMSPGSEYNIAIIDFGNIIPLDSDGRLMMGNLADLEGERNELFRCNMKIGLCFDSPWDINKLIYFNNEYMYSQNTLFGITPYAEETVNMFQNLQIAERDSDVLYMCLNEMLGLNTQKTKKKGLIR